MASVLLALLAISGHGHTDELDTSGALDRPLFDPAASPGTLSVTLSVSTPGPNVTPDPATLQEQVQAEQQVLEALPRPQLQELADTGARGAQIALGADFAREATQLGFAPAAANDALADAARWYSLAASRGFPGAPSLDQAGIRFYPIRIQRDSRP